MSGGSGNGGPITLRTFQLSMFASVPSIEFGGFQYCPTQNIDQVDGCIALPGGWALARPTGGKGDFVRFACDGYSIDQCCQWAHCFNSHKNASIICIAHEHAHSTTV